MRDYFKAKTWVITTLMFIFAFGLSLAIVYYEFGYKQNVRTSSASSINNITGWGWSSNIGWISFNCTNDSPACADSSYGVSVNLQTGDFSGYAWNSNVGWIDFDPTMDLVTYPGCGYPEAPCNATKYIPSTGAVTGWAKILNMGDDGWIKLSGSWSNGVTINSSGVFSGWAWNANNDSSGIGWISFNCSNDNPACGSSNYKVVASKTVVASGTGWAWNSDIGWISFNCTNDSPACVNSNYEVVIDSVSGNFGGYAWNSDVGWIDFGPVMDLVTYPGCGYPEAPCYAAKYDNDTGAVTGWAKILTMGDGGWIKLSGGWTNGVEIDPLSGIFSGWAWNAGSDGSGIGWISFNCSNDNPACGSSNYKVAVVININGAPSITNLTAPNWNYTQANVNPLRANLQFNMVDIDKGSYGSAYQIIVKKADDTAVLDTGKCTGYLTPSADCKIDNSVCMNNGSAGCINSNDCVCQYVLDETLLNYNQGYKWSAMIWDDKDEVSVLKSYDTNPDTNNNDGVISTFTTYKHKFPKVSATYLPASPASGEQIKFIDTSKTYLTASPTTEVACDSSKCSWLWTVPVGATIDDPATSTPTITLNNSGYNNIILKVTDKIDGYYSQLYIPVTIGAQAQLPNWKEVKPE
ncbi:MAG: hypothetical protein WCL13_01230 [bacterium]